MKNYIILGLLLALVGCKDERKFEWSADLKQIIDPNSKDWLKKNRFPRIWNEKERNEDIIVFDNQEQIFTFMANFKNENDNFKYTSENDKFYQQEVVLFKDNHFGEPFVYGALLYEPEELFISRSYSEMGSVIFSGQNAINYHSDLAETLVFSKSNNYKTAIYWVNSNNKTFLFGFYQKEKLVFEFGFPCNQNKKIKEINQNRNFAIKEWANVTSEDLAINNNPKSFWKNSFKDIYFGEYSLLDIQVKLKDTDFKSLPIEEVKTKIKIIFS